MFIFDAWAHQGDPLRRAFLEQQILSFSSCSWLRLEDWEDTRETLARRRKVSETKNVPRLTWWGIAVVFAAAITPIGLAMLSGTQVPVPFRLLTNPQDYKGPLSSLMWWGLWLSLCPLILLLLRVGWSLALRCDWIRRMIPQRAFKTDARERTHRWDFLSLFVTQSDTVTRKETTETPDPTSLEFNSIFVKVLRAALRGTDRKLVIVIDNLDRVPTPEALSVWATMRTFFEVSGTAESELVRRIWLIVPFDKSAARRLWPDRGDRLQDGQSGEIAQRDWDGGGAAPLSLAEAFIQKTFQVSFHVSSPVVSDLGRYLMGKLAEAFPDHANGNDFPQILGLYLVLRTSAGRPVTPRDVKLFINKVGALHRQWGDDIPLAHQALYILCEEDIAQDPRVLKRRDFPDERAMEVLENKETMVNLAALHFGVDPKKALGVIIGPRIQAALMSGDTTELAKSSEVDGFPVLLDSVVGELCTTIAPQEPRCVALAALACSGVALLDVHQKRVVWGRLRNAAGKATRWKGLDAKSGQGIAAIFKNTEGTETRRLALAVANALSEDVGDQDDKSAKEWGQGVLPVLREIQAQGILDVIKASFAVPGTPASYLNALEYLYSEADPELRSLFKPKCGEAMVLGHVSQQHIEKQPTQAFLQILQMLMAIPIRWPIKILIDSVQQKLTASVAPAEAGVLLDALDALTRAQNPQPAQQALRWLCRHGVIPLLMFQARNASLPALFGQCALLFLEHNSDRGIEEHRGNSPQGVQAFTVFLNPQDTSYAAPTSEFARRILASGKVEWLLELHGRQPDIRNLVSAVLRNLAAEESPERFVSSAVFLRDFQIFAQHIQQEAIERLARKLSAGGDLLQVLLERDFQQYLAPIYSILLQERATNQGRLEDHITRGLRALSKESWAAELAHEGKTLELLLRALEYGVRVELTAAFENALTDYTNSFAAAKKTPSRAQQSWRILPSAMAQHSWHTFYANVFDLLERSDQPTREALLFLYESGFFPPKLSQTEADQAVRRLFKEIIKARKQPLLDWLQRVFDARGDVLKSAQNDFQKSFREDLANAITGLTEGPARARIRGLAQHEAVKETKPTKIDVAGPFELSAIEATLHGPTICVESIDGRLNIGYWASREDFAEWAIELQWHADFLVSVEYACAADCGGDVLLTIGDKQVKSSLSPTGGWQNFSWMDFGSAHLDEGAVSVTVKAAGEFKNALLNLRSVKFSATAGKAGKGPVPETIN